jgi:XisH protein
MPAHDVFHTAVREGLIKEGWTITDDPLIVEYGGLDLYIDLAAEKLIAAEKGDHRIAVEVKTFLGPSLVTDFHVALGQFLNYRIALKEQHPGRSCTWQCPLRPIPLFLHIGSPRRRASDMRFTRSSSIPNRRFLSDG